jgi:hypothetical protein
MPKRLCSTAACGNYATAKGLCDLHRREKERNRSVERRGGYSRGPYKDATDARDADPDYHYPKRDQ